jgi:hypothetical protein
MSRPTQQAAPLHEADNYNIISRIRTITTMLQVLQQVPSEEKKPMELQTWDDKQELQVLGAMATLLVQRYQVTAVTTGGSSSDVTVIACAEDSSKSTLDQASLTESFFASINPRRPKHPKPEPPLNSGVDRITVIQNWTTQINVNEPLKFLSATW